MLNEDKPEALRVKALLDTYKETLSDVDVERIN